jgi:putative membrane protein
VGTWETQPLPLVAGAVALALYAQGFVRLRRRAPGYARVAQAILWLAGVLVGVLALVSPLDSLGEDKLLTAHMAQHLLLGDVSSLLLVLGCRGPLTVFLLPQIILRPLAHSRPLRRALSFLLRPRATFVVWAAAVGAWHVPAAYDAAIASTAVHAAEHASFAAAGLLVWIQILDPARHGRMSPGRRALYAGAIIVAGMPLAEVLLVAAPLYPHYTRVIDRPFGLTAATDQARAGLLMMAEQIATLGTAAALLVWTHVEQLQQESPAT